MRFSIVVPVYKVEKYIGKCLDSVLTQSFSDYEIVVVDDETPDGSMAIVAQRAAAYPGKIRVLHQQNKGLGGARNTGAAAAEGEYLLFLDSDDYLAPGTLEALDGLLKQEPCQILIFNHRPVTEDGKPLAADPIPECPENVNIATCPELFLLPPSAWNRVCLRSFYEQCSVPFPEKTLYEDAVTRALLARAERVRVCDRYFYHYVQRKNSIMHQSISPRMLDILKVTDDLLPHMEQIPERQIWGECLEMSLIRSILSVLDQISPTQPEHPMVKTMAEYISRVFPDWEKNPRIIPVMRQRLRLLHEQRWAEYSRTVKRTAWKRQLLGCPLIAWLNRLRKGEL